ncbi:unnamed protein product [Pleuronectes platessa]|uniref:Uncharacterized protein n=1 Tax=Pleuronectes platessa TaxID=8262 RepID=A0A9N7Z127_PLEPL|nr:unnamed protein product [Pleuronectes platessa]
MSRCERATCLKMAKWKESLRQLHAPKLLGPSPEVSTAVFSLEDSSDVPNEGTEMMESVDRAPAAAASSSHYQELAQPGPPKKRRMETDPEVRRK